MQLSPKQKIAQRILAEHSSIRVGQTSLMYTARASDARTSKPCIVASVSKKITPKAVNRNYNKRVLRAILRENTTKEVLTTYDWMWICKDAKITKELRLALIDKIKTISK